MGRMCTALFVVLASGCANTSRHDIGALPSASIAEIQAVPFFPQDAYQCGPAALATVLSWAGKSTDPQRLSPDLYIEDRRGSLQVELLAATRRQGFLPYVHDDGFEDLWTLLSAGTPVLVLQNLAFSWYPKWHYAVVVGFDAKEGELLLRSGRERLRRESLRVFSGSWAYSDSWMMTVYQPGQIPPGAKEVDFLQAVSALEQAGQGAAAMKSYRAATEQWPESLLAWMALGNAHYQQKDYSAAELAYGNAHEAESQHPAPVHNLAWALIKQGRDDEARPYAELAVELSQSLPEELRGQYQSAQHAVED